MNADLTPHLNTNPQISILIDGVRSASPEFKGMFSGFEWNTLTTKLSRAGIKVENVQFLNLQNLSEQDLRRISSNVIITMGEKALNATTGKFGIDKWQLSPLDALPEFTCKKIIPTFSLSRLNAQHELGVYRDMAFIKAANESDSVHFKRHEEKFRLNPSYDETIAILEFLLTQNEVACDVETGYGQINTVGFAWSESDAIAINTLPDRLDDEKYHYLWKLIGRILQNENIGKIFQNYIYDTSYFSAYGILTENISHDTMHAMKVLWPEFDMNLGNVGRIYTNRPYWKDDGKLEEGEAKKKDWGNIRDWSKHYTYNCRDTTGTFEASRNQRDDIRQRGLESFFQYVMSLSGPIREMCGTGIPVNLEAREKLKIDVQSKIDELTKEFNEQVGYELNPRSSQQVIKFLEEQGVKVPQKYNKYTKKTAKSVDSSSVKKIMLKHPNIKALKTMSEIKSYYTALTRYVDFQSRPNQKNLHYLLNITGTETLRFAGNKDPWDCGFNIQTIPREGGDVSIKSMFEAPKGYSFIEIDLRQAESRFVAYDSADKNLIDMLESGADVHSHVGHEILKGLRKPASEFSKEWRQLGKKSGHGANYAMKANTFVETVFMEMDMVLSRNEAEVILNAYHNLFPGIRRWHESIKKELWNNRKLSAPSGWERYFYGRYGDDMFKEAFAWRPQHTIPWITNHLMLFLKDQRYRLDLDFKFLVQVHDSLILLAADEFIGDVADLCLDTKPWHPVVNLIGGTMVIPTEVKFGKCLANLKEWGE